MEFFRVVRGEISRVLSETPKFPRTRIGAELALWSGVNASRAFLVLLVVGCNASHTTPPAASATTATSAPVDEEAVDDLLEHHLHHHHGGLTMFVAMSLDTLGVPPAQHDRIAALQSALYAKMSPAREAENAVDNVLADGIAAGAIDRAKVDTAIDRLRVDAGAVFGNATETLDALHAALDPSQRAALVDKVRAHWTLWLEANPLDGVDGPVAFGQTIDMTPAQLDQVKPAFARILSDSPQLDVKTVTNHLDAFAKAFAADAFDAHALPQGSIGAYLAGWGATRLARFCEASLPMLTPEQRSKLLEMLREHQKHEEPRQ